jgi:hypothetical protein
MVFNLPYLRRMHDAVLRGITRALVALGFVLTLENGMYALVTDPGVEQARYLLFFFASAGATFGAGILHAHLIKTRLN